MNNSVGDYCKEGTCHPVHHCGSLMCFNSFWTIGQCGMEEYATVYEALNTHTIIVSCIDSWFVLVFFVGFVSKKNIEYYQTYPF